MIGRLVSFCLARRWLVLAVLTAISCFGLYALGRLDVDAYPDIGDVTAQVITQYPGHAAEEVEQQITIPLERELNGTPGLHVMRSKSTFGLSLITLVFEDGTEDYFERQRIQERIGNVTLPPGVQAGLDAVTSPTGEIYRYTVESHLRSPRALRDLENWVVIPRLKQVPGVVDVNPFGGENYQFQVYVDPDKLVKYGLALHQVTDAIAANNVNAGGSLIVRGQQSIVVRGLGAITKLSDLETIVLAQKAGTPVFVRDIGHVELGALERQGILGKDDNDDAVSGITLLLRGANPSRVLAGIHQKVRELNTKVLPPDVKVVPYLDRTALVQTTLHTVSRTLIEGMVLVVLVLIFFLGSLRGALLVALTIPFALLFAFALMHLTNIPANLLSLGAIDFGIIVDGAIVLMEVILRRREKHPDHPLLPADARAAALEVAKPIFFATLIIITAYLPLFAFERVERKLFTPMAFTIGYALLGALLFALTAVPALAYMAYRRPGKGFRNPVLEWLGRRYDAYLQRVVKRPSLVLALALGVGVLTAVLAVTVGREFLPYLDEGSIWMQINMPPGISIRKATEMARDFRKLAGSFREVSYVVTQTGRNDDATDPWTFSHIESSIGLKPYDQWGGDKQALIERMSRSFAARLPGMDFGFSQPMIDGVNDKIAGAHSEIVIKVYGDDFAETRRIAQGITGVLSQVRGAADVAIDQEPPLPQLQIRINRQAAARFGINVGDIATMIETAIGGKVVTNVYLGEKSYDVGVRFIESVRGNPEAIANLTVPSSTSARIPLSQVSDIQVGAGESTITREMGRRHMTVKVDLRGRDLASFIDEAQRRIDRAVPFDHAKYEIAWGGQFENQQRAQGRLAVIVPAALALIFLILYAGFGDVRHAVLILIVVPLALFGGLAALMLRGMTINVSSSVGFIALFGVAVQNGVIMVANLNHRRESGASLMDALRRGAGVRLRPVLMTATVAILGLLPAATNHGVGSDVQRPLATVIVGGLLSATVLTLLILPVAYFVLERWNERRQHHGATGPAGGPAVPAGNRPAPPPGAAAPSGAAARLVIGIGLLALALGAAGTGAVGAQPAPPAPAAGEGATAAPLSLKDFLAEVAAANLDYAAARYNVPIAEAQLAAARTSPNPTLDAGRSGYDITDQGSNREPANNNLGISQTLEMGGKRGRRVAVARANVAQAAATLDDFFRTLRANAATAFVDALTKRRTVEEKGRSAEALDHLVEANRQRLAVGDIGEIDVTQSRVDALQAHADLLAAQSDAALALIALDQLRGNAVGGAPPVPAGNLAGPARSFDEAALIADALQHRPDVIAARRALDAARAGIAVAAALAVPDLTVAFSYQDNQRSHNVIAPGPAFSSVGLSVSVPVPLWNRYRGELEQARVGAAQAEVNLKNAELHAGIDVRQALARYRLADQRAAQFQGGALDDAAAVYRGRLFSYEHGAASLLDVLNAQTVESNVRLAYLGALDERAKALVNVAQAAGTWDIDF
jgi:cobalt-zinc-cadmium resistance protein CzcA